MSWVYNLEEELFKLKNKPPYNNDDTFNNLVKVSDYISKHGLNNEKGASDQAIGEQKDALDKNIFQQGSTEDKLSTTEPDKNNESKKIVDNTFKLKSKTIKLNYYEIASKRLVPYQDKKEYYIDFEKTKKVLQGSELQLNGLALAKELVERLRSNFDPDNKKEIIKLFSSLKKEDWKKLLFGEQGMQKNNLLHFAGLMETRRKYQGVDEHLQIMLSEKFSGENFENEYFIPTGFIDVGNNNFLNIKEIIDHNIEINPNTLQIKVLKDVSIFVFEEFVQSDNVNQELQDIFEQLKCKQECIVPANFNIGDSLEAIVKLKVDAGGSRGKTIKKDINNNVIKLISELLKICPSQDLYERLQRIKKTYQIKE